MTPSARYDVVVIGGGAAGLSGAITLARSRRSVLVVDAGDPRNSPAEGVHNYLGLEGVSPLELLQRGRAALAEYGGQLRRDEATAAERVRGGFAVTLRSGDRVRGRRLLVTSGLRDRLPDVPGLAERWGRDVLHCPYCHGWEVRDQVIGVLATGPLSVHQTLLFRQLSERVTVIDHAGTGFDEGTLEQLAARDVPVVPGPATAVVVKEGRLTGVRLADGSLLELDALTVSPPFAARSELLVSLGLETAELAMGDHVLGTHVPVDAMAATAVPGVYAAGNVTDPQAVVLAAAAAGVKAGGAINADLVAEETREAVLARRTVPA